MSEWRDVMEARNEATKYVAEVRNAGLSQDEVLLSALLAISAELRALGTLIDFARGDAR